MKLLLLTCNESKLLIMFSQELLLEILQSKTLKFPFSLHIIPPLPSAMFSLKVESDMINSPPSLIMTPLSLHALFLSIMDSFICVLASE